VDVRRDQFRSLAVHPVRHLPSKSEGTQESAIRYGSSFSQSGGREGENLMKKIKRGGKELGALTFANVSCRPELLRETKVGNANLMNRRQKKEEGSLSSYLEVLANLKKGGSGGEVRKRKEKTI